VTSVAPVAPAVTAAAAAVALSRTIEVIAASTVSWSAAPRLSAVVTTPTPISLVSTRDCPGRSPALVSIRSGCTSPTTTSPNLGSAHLVEVLGESANLAVLNGTQIVYVAQAPGRHAMRMFTEVGRRVSPHCTAVGKALLALMPSHRIHDILERTRDGGAHAEHHHRSGGLPAGVGEDPRAGLRDR
jgi:Bacterial transcriptional regulator